MKFRRWFAKAWDRYDSLHWLIHLLFRAVLVTIPVFGYGYYNGYVRGANVTEAKYTSYVEDGDDMCYAEDYAETEISI